MSEKIKKRKIMLVGTGFVGMSFAYSMLSEKGIDELVLVDVNEDKAEENKWILVMVLYMQIQR